MTAVRSAVGVSEEFEVKVGLYQGSGLSLLLFAIVMDNITTGVRKGVPRSMLFGDDTVLVNGTEGSLKELEDWRQVMEARGLHVRQEQDQENDIKQANYPELML